MINVRLHDVHVFEMTGSGKSCFHGRAQIDADYFSGAPTSGQQSVPALSASALEHNLALEKRGNYRGDPTEKLVRIETVAMCEMLPLPAEVFGGGSLVRFQVFRGCETRNTADYWKPVLTTLAGELALDNFGGFDYSF